MSGQHTQGSMMMLAAKRQQDELVESRRELAAVRASLASAEQMIAERDARIAQFEAAMESLRADVLHGVDGLDNDQVNIVLGMIDFHTPSEPPDEEPTSGPLFDGTSPDTEGGSCD